MARAAKVFLRLLAAACALSAASGEELAAQLATDDECLAGQDCGLNALQMRGAAATEALPTQDLDNDTEQELGSAPDGVLAARCNNGAYCAMGGYLIVAGKADAVGMETINGGNVGYYDNLMYAAGRRCGGPNCVLITNPMHHRTQSRFHIHYRFYNGAGSSLKHRLEQSVCRGGGWQKGHFPCGGKAAYFSGFPAVFSQAFGAGSLAHAAISVWPKSCHGGTIILVSYHCSIEHTISSR
mmetsp:Transcript_93348/g.278718  ORF Transcript_93348/g.278718 Transcript_93348/m.278718 type:complete len:240 (+) Transcript_93348:56-775(+)